MISTIHIARLERHEMEVWVVFEVRDGRITRSRMHMGEDTVRNIAAGWIEQAANQ